VALCGIKLQSAQNTTRAGRVQQKGNKCPVVSIALINDEETLRVKRGYEGNIFVFQAA
jgi:hypothetical protein